MRCLYLPAFVLLLLGYSGSSGAEEPEVKENNWIVVGILALDDYDGRQQYIATSYVKYVESAGARVVPIFVNQDRIYYEKLVNKVNAILLTGGGADLLTSQYAKAASTLLDLAFELNQNGTYFPVWCTCLSFEKLITYHVGNNSWMTNGCFVENISLNLDIESKFTKPTESRLLRDASDDFIKMLQTKQIAPNYHRVCLSAKTFRSLPMANDYNLISTNTFKNYTFVSTIEHKKYPIYAVQWHPEKNQFEFVIGPTVGNITHDRYAVQVGQYFANFLVNEARKNSHHFPNKKDEIDSLIYNYNQYRKYTGKEEHASFEEKFIFPNKASVNSVPWFVFTLLLCIRFV